VAIDWGSYEANSGRGIRVGVEVIMGSVSHTSDHVNITINYYTQNSGGGWSGRNDAQTLNLSLDYVGSINYTNNEGLGIQLRGTRSDVHNYGANSYGSSPGTRSYKALVSGADNGVTPGATSSAAIPARPFAAPAAVIWPSANYINDGQINVQWLNDSTSGEPYDGIQLWASSNGGSSYGLVTTVTNILPSNQTTVVGHTGLSPNQKWVYLIRPYNSVGHVDTVTNYQWTSPGIPANPTRTVSGTVDQVISWTNSCSYPEYQTEVWRSVDGVWSNWRTVAAGVTTTTDVGTDPTKKYKYRLRAANTSTASLYSAYTAETTETAGVTSPPAAPTGLTPNSVTLLYDPTIATIFSWTYNSTDGYPQSKYEIQYREVGGSTWTSLGQVTSTGQQSTVPANTFVYSKSYEWQVRTWGVSATAGAWSATATFNTMDPTPIRYPLYLNTSTGQVEADSTGAGPGTTPGGLILSFGAASTTWLGTHNLNQTPVDVTLMDTGGNQIGGDVSYPSPNQVQAHFVIPIAGSMLIQK
jgi:hypothetical protein